MAQRLARAKAKIRVAAHPLPDPCDDALPARRDAVLDVVYLVFNEGYAASSGDAHVRRSLCAEGLRLAALIAELMPEQSEALGLLALLLVHQARSETRVDAAGALVLLEHQDRSRWDRAAIEQATRLATRALRLGSPGRYVLQAAIALEHANAPTAAATPLGPHRGVLLAPRRAQPDPVVELNRAVAIAMAGDPPAGSRGSTRSPPPSTATTTSTPPAPTCCAGSASASRRAPRTGAHLTRRQRRRARLPPAPAGPDPRLTVHVCEASGERQRVVMGCASTASSDKGPHCATNHASPRSARPRSPLPSPSWLR